MGISGLTRFGLGLAALGRPAYMTVTHGDDFPRGRSVEDLAERTHRMLDRAFAAGIRVFDAARSYGRAEQFLRGWIDARRLAPGDVFVSSKWGYRYTGDWQVDGRVQEVKEHSLAMLRTQAAESQAILGPYLRLYQIHSAAKESGVLENARVLDELRRLRAGGLMLGVTATGPRQLETLRRAIELRAEGAPLFSAVQATWNLLERSAGPGLQEAHEAGLAVLVKEPLANGRLTPKGDVRALSEIAARLDATEDAVALAFVLAQQWADTVLLGAATEAQLDSNLRARELRLGEDVLRALEAMEEPDYWSRRAKLPWS